MSAGLHVSAGLLFKIACACGVTWWIFGSLWANRPDGTRIEFVSGLVSFGAAVAMCIFLVAAVLA